MTLNFPFCTIFNFPNLIDNLLILIGTPDLPIAIIILPQFGSSPAIAGEDPNWGRIIMAIGKSGVPININKLSIKFGKLNIVQNGKLSVNYNENDASDYMKNDAIDINVNISSGSKNFTVYTMDFTKRYIEINSDYRS